MTQQTNAVQLISDASGKPRADSRDIADRFGKRHADVLRAIDEVVSQLEDTQRNFAFSEYQDASGKTNRCFSMDRDGFTLLAMGFTGADALKWKLAYIAAFNSMEDQIKHAAFAPLSLPSARELAILVIAAEDRADAERSGRVQAEAKVAIMAPSVAALERISEADGSLCPTDAAKTLKVKPTLLTKWLRANGWVYSRGGSNKMIGRQDKINQSLLEHKCYISQNSNGDEVTRSQVMVTSKGLAKLATVFKTEEPEQKSLEV